MGPVVAIWGAHPRDNCKIRRELSSQQPKDQLDNNQSTLLGPLVCLSLQPSCLVTQMLRTLYNAFVKSQDMENKGMDK